MLLSGNHRAIDSWRRKQALKRTLLQRPDLFDLKKLDKGDSKLLLELAKEIELPDFIKNFLGGQE